MQLADVKFSDVAAWIAELSAKRGPVIVETAASVLRRICLHRLVAEVL